MLGRLVKKLHIGEPKWVKYRCPSCNALLFEIDTKIYKKNSVRVKCRLCKDIKIQ